MDNFDDFIKLTNPETPLLMPAEERLAILRSRALDVILLGLAIARAESLSEAYEVYARLADVMERDGDFLDQAELADLGFVVDDRGQEVRHIAPLADLLNKGRTLLEQSVYRAIDDARASTATTRELASSISTLLSGSPHG